MLEASMYVGTQADIADPEHHHVLHGPTPAGTRHRGHIRAVIGRIGNARHQLVDPTAQSVQGWPCHTVVLWLGWKKVPEKESTAAR